jgi:hypothetical protein
MNAKYILLASTAALFLSPGVLAEAPGDITAKEDIAEYEQGVAAATNDLKNGLIKYEIVGMPSGAAYELKERAKKEYNIDVVFHGCIPGPQIFRDRGYHDTVIESLTKKYGFDPLQRMDEDLRAAKSTQGLMKLRASLDTVRSTPRNRHFDVAAVDASPLVGFTRTRIELALGTPNKCDPLMAPCRSTNDWFYSFYSLPDTWVGGGPELLLHFGPDNVCTSVAWWHTQ